MAFFSNLVRSVNQATHSQGPRFIVNHHIARYGHMTELTIDPDQKIITATLQLKGEKDPLFLRLTHYDLQTVNDATTLTVGEVYLSREWMQTLATDLLQNKPLPVPAQAAKWLKMIL
jgi:hypothetical protein